MEVGGVAIMRPVCSDWESGSYSSGQSPLNGIHMLLSICPYNQANCILYSVYPFIADSAYTGFSVFRHLESAKCCICAS